MNPWLAIYQALFPAVGVVVAAKMLALGRGRTLREGLADMRQRLGAVSADDASRAGPGALWLHAASVGEIGGAAALLRALGGRDPRLGGRKAFVTTSTVAGREAAAKLGASAALLAPMDLLFAVDRFLAALRPKALILLETELWPATLEACVRRGIPFALANARLTARSFPRYRWIRPLVGPYLARAAVVAAQTEDDAARFAALGVPAGRLSVTGNIKFDVTAPPATAVDEARRLLRALGWKPGEPVWCAGSTRPGGEEEAVLDAFAALKERHPSLRLILAPRHIERSAEAAAELSRRGIAYARASKPQGPAEPRVGAPDCLLVDVLGRLRPLFAASDIAFVGGTLVPVGGHNLLEPAASGVPVLFGPHTWTIQGPADSLAKAGGFRVDDGAALEARLEALLGDPEARARAGRQALETASAFSGAAGRTAALLVERLAL